MTHRWKIILLTIFALLPLSSTAATGAMNDSTVTDTTDKVYIPPFELKMVGRTYGDHIRLRWAPTEYAPWRMLNDYGYQLVRITYGKQFAVDTLSSCIRPLSLTQLKQRYALSDSLAGAAAQLLHEHGTPLSAVSGDGMTGVMEVYEEQQSRFAYAMLVAEFRADLAESMGLMYDDHEVKAGNRYEYILRPLTPDSVIRIRPVSIELTNTPYHPQALEVRLTDSISGFGKLLLSWPQDTKFTAYDIERREGNGQWQRLNKNPFITLFTIDTGSQQYFSFEDKDLHAATYEYRLRGYDSFGEKTLPSAPHKVIYPEMRTPSAPLLKRFIIYDEDRADNKAFADIIWKKDSIEADLTGYDIFYYHETEGSEWIKLNPTLIAPQDTIYRAEITNLPAGYICIKAYNTYGNAIQSMPFQINIVDRTPPAAPSGLGHVLSPNGVVHLHWKANTDNDIRGYQVFAANDTTHFFQPLPGGLIRDTVTTDTLHIAHINQRYIYYRVAAYDYAGNASPLSAVLQVARLNYKAPLVCRIDSTWQEDNLVHMRWIASPNNDISHFRLFRKNARDRKWTLLRRIEYNEVSDGYIHVDDSLTHTAMKDKYYYALEAINTTGISSGLSFEAVFNIQRDRIINVAPKLKGQLNKNGTAQLEWEVPDDLAPHYYVLEWDRGLGNEEYIYAESINSSQHSINNSWIQKGKTVSYQLTIYFKDGRRSHPSNAVTLTRPADPAETTERR